MLRLLDTKKQDNKNPFHMMSLGTNLNGSLRLCEEAAIKDVLRRVLDELFGDRGCLIEHFKAEGGLAADGGSIKWSRGVYRPIFRDGLLISVEHAPSKTTVAVPKEKSISSDFCMDFNWTDTAAVFDKEPFPKLKLQNFFDKKKKEQSI